MCARTKSLVFIGLRTLSYIPCTHVLFSTLFFSAGYALFHARTGGIGGLARKILRFQRPGFYPGPEVLKSPLR
jgi:hypothetical protein